MQLFDQPLPDHCFVCSILYAFMLKTGSLQRLLTLCDLIWAGKQQRNMSTDAIELVFGVYLLTLA